MGAISHKATATSRAASVKRLASGEWKRDFDEQLTKAEQGDRTAYTTLKLMKGTYGIWNFPELKQYATDNVTRLAPMYEEG